MSGKRLNPFQHALKRPDTYIGSTKTVIFETYILDHEGKVQIKKVRWNAGLFNIIREIGSNCIDNKWRSLGTSTEMKSIKIEWNPETRMLSFWNDGNHIPVEKKTYEYEDYRNNKVLKEVMYPAEIFFGEMLAGTNFDDDEERKTSGRNGMGAKCLAPNTPVLLWNGSIVPADKIEVGSQLVGDDGTMRVVNSVVHGTGQMYLVEQTRGDSYVVNENHILTLCVPFHKVILWSPKKGWFVSWWDRDSMRMRTKFGLDTSNKCDECGQLVCDCEIFQYYRQSPDTIHNESPFLDVLNEKVVASREMLEEFCETIDDDNIVDISIKDYIALEMSRLNFSGLRGKGVEWDRMENLYLDPYMLGLWLGNGADDGYCIVCDERGDREIAAFIERWTTQHDAIISRRAQRFYIESKSNFEERFASPLRRALERYNLIDNKHIPLEFMQNARDIRLKVLAGLIDAIGIANKDKSRIVIMSNVSQERLTKDIITLVRSLGFGVEKIGWMDCREQAHRIVISGCGIEHIPTLLLRRKCPPPKRNASNSTGIITVTPIGEGKYVGFSIKGRNERFLLGDFTVTHNCTNVFSARFEVEHTDPDAGKKFLQIYTNNARDRSKPKISSFRKKKGWTKISFEPDFQRFGYDVDQYGEDFIGVLGMYVLEMAAMTALPVHFSVAGESKKYWLKTFDKYVRMFYPDVKENKLATITLPNGDECVIVESHVDPRADIPDMLEDTRHLAFVNGLKTKDGGVHVDAWRDAIYPTLVRSFNARKLKGGVTLKTSAKEIYPYLTLFIRTEMDKPSFDTQTKDRLNGPDYEIFPEGKTKAVREERDSIKTDIEKNIKKMLKWNFIPLLEEKLTAKTDRGKSKKGKKRVSLGDKAQDANQAGRQSEKCILYITEGLSAKAMVVRGISTLPDGQDYNGVFAVQGKFINVVNASVAEVTANEEVNFLKEMLNLRLGVDYSIKENFDTLRYHRVRLTTDMDDDGIHIRGLLINFFYSLWPSLINGGFIDSLSTAVTKVTLVGKKDMLFYSNPEYKRWYEETGAKMKIAEVKYLKGLGSINPKDVPGYFSNPKTVSYFAEGDENEYMELGFDDNKSDWRKDWLLRDMRPADKAPSNNENSDDEDNIIFEDESSGEESSEDTPEEREFVYDGQLGVSTFVDTQLIIYHRMALRRALPNLMDGFKESQRKAFYAIRSRNYKRTKDLEKVMGAVKEATGYHHGGASLLGTIKNMAVRYPGSNNIPLLQNDGEFGCLHPNTPILMWNDDANISVVVPAKNVRVGDLLTGDDEKPRIVKKLVGGIDDMYRISQSNGIDYVVNSEHILTVRYSEHKVIRERDNAWIAQYYDANTKRIKIKSICYSSDDVEGITKYAACEKLIGWLLDIPDEWAIFDINIQEYLALSDSLRAKLKGIKINREVKNRSIENHIISCDITVTKEGQGNYVGWHIDGNERFLLGDGTVTHNTRLVGGKDAAAARYIATALEDVAKAIFPTVDDALLTKVIEDNEEAEFEFFLPIICMLLVNGADGIASGFSTSIPNYNPKEIARWTRAWLDEKHKEMPPLIPWYRGITGPIELEKTAKKADHFDRWRTKGVLFECGKGCTAKIGKKKCRGENGWWHITDLPVGKWTNSFKEHLEYLENGTPPKGKKWKKLENKCITDFRDYSTTNLVHFMIKPSKAGDGWDPDIDTTLKKLQTTKSLKNMVAIDGNNYPERYASPEDILKKWCPIRLVYYTKRRSYLLDLLDHDFRRASNRYNYIKAVAVDMTLDMHQEDEKLEKAMLKLKLQKMTSKVGGTEEPTFDYLLSMQMRSMTVRKLEELKKEMDSIQGKIDELKTKTGADLWREDLDNFDKAYQKYLKDHPLE